MLILRIRLVSVRSRFMITMTSLITEIHLKTDNTDSLFYNGV